MASPKNAKSSTGSGSKSSGFGGKAPSQANNLQQNLNEWVQKIKTLEGKLNAERKKTQELAGNLSIERKIRENERKENTRNYDRVVELGYTRRVEIASPVLKFENIPTDLLDLENTWNNIKVERLPDSEFDLPIPDFVEDSFNPTGKADALTSSSLPPAMLAGAAATAMQRL
ncbi:hypothetical protein N7533_007577 [Penicillium manginii]|uniref:uncharacterized protein n=1 Tax=Penicillium manginii TaxID=203109 RepID=UPI0025468654|nr:uncharacterized protein N7533_007577 [Penicillium manginii]KAJ5750549.1 hypothetical protein N7533_007577 [Penicillium manginii]